MQVSQSSNQLSGEPEKDYSNNIILFNITSPCQNASSGIASNFRKRLRLLSDLYMLSICKDFIYATLLYHEPHLAIKEAIFNININSLVLLTPSCISQLPHAFLGQQKSQFASLLNCISKAILPESVSVDNYRFIQSTMGQFYKLTALKQDFFIYSSGSKKKRKSDCIQIALVSLQFQILFNEKQCLFSKLQPCAEGKKDNKMMQVLMEV